MISIAMTTYNGEKYLRNQLDSILNQSISDFELVICDDCSKDSTREILKDYANRDSRIKIILNESNLGFKRNFEKALLNCSGDYIALSDQDDIWEKEHLQILMKTIGTNMLTCGDSQCFIENDGQMKDIFKLSELEFDLSVLKSNEDILKRIFFRGNPYQGAAMLMKKEFLDIVLPIPTDISFHDVWFALCAACNNSFVYVNEIVNNYRQHETQVTSHVKRNLFQKILRMPKFETIASDREFYAFHLMEHLENYSENIQILINFVLEFYRNRKNKIYRWKKYSFYMKYIFPYLYKNTTKLNQLSRKIQYMFF